MSNLMLPIFLSDVTILYDTIPIDLISPSARGVLWQAATGCFLLEVPKVARYLVENGRSISIDPAPDVPPAMVEHHLGMLPMAALLYQRGMLAIHAAAVTNDQGVLLLAGDSGSGKSTLLTALLLRDWRMLADDLTIVGLNEQGQPVVYPTYSGIPLWPDTLTQLGIDPFPLPFIDANRRVFKPSVRPVSSPQLLRAIYRLNIHSKSAIELEGLAGSACFRTLGTVLYNSHVADALCDRAAYLRCVSAIAHSVPFKILRRPRGIWCVDELENVITK